MRCLSFLLSFLMTTNPFVIPRLKTPTNAKLTMCHVFAHSFIHSSSSSSSFNTHTHVIVLVKSCGSFGRVKLATHSSSGTLMALKILQKDTVVENRQTKNVSREKEIMARLQHPNVLRLFGTFQDQVGGDKTIRG
jgi:hypothetical protein